MKLRRSHPGPRFRPSLSQLEGRENPASPFSAFGAAAGGSPLVQVDRPDGSTLARFAAFEDTFFGGVRAAVGELDGNAGTVEVVATAGPGGGPRVRVFAVDVNTGAVVATVADFQAFEESYRGGVRVAVGRVAGGATDQIILGTDAGGGPRVRVLNLANGVGVPAGGPLTDFFAFEDAFRGGVRVGAGDVDGNPANGDELIVGAGPGGGARVRVFRADGTEFSSFFALPGTGAAGVNVVSEATAANGVRVDAQSDDFSQRNAGLNTAGRTAAAQFVAQNTAFVNTLNTFNGVSGLNGVLFAGATGANGTRLVTEVTPAAGVTGGTPGAVTGTGVTGLTQVPGGVLPGGAVISTPLTSPGLFTTTGAGPVTIGSPLTAPGVVNSSTGGLFNTVGGPGFATSTNTTGFLGSGTGTTFGSTTSGSFVGTGTTPTTSGFTTGGIGTPAALFNTSGVGRF